MTDLTDPIAELEAPIGTPDASADTPDAPIGKPDAPTTAETAEPLTSDPSDSTEAEAVPPAPAPTERGLVRRLLRLALIVGAVAGLVAAVVYAAPIVDERIIRPVETNAADTAALQTAVDEASSRIELLETEVTSLRTDLDSVQGDVDGVSEAVASNVTRLDDIDTMLADQTGRIDDLDDLAATLSEEVGAARSATVLEIQFLKSTELLSRARLFLYQANYGLAAEDVQAARDLLADLQADLGDEGPVDASTLTEALSRIDLVLGALPDRPVAASAYLDIAWRLLLDEPLSPVLTPSTDPLAAPGTNDDAADTSPEN